MKFFHGALNLLLVSALVGIWIIGNDTIRADPRDLPVWQSVSPAILSLVLIRVAFMLPLPGHGRDGFIILSRLFYVVAFPVALLAAIVYATFPRQGLTAIGLLWNFACFLSFHHCIVFEYWVKAWLSPKVEET